MGNVNCCASHHRAVVEPPFSNAVVIDNNAHGNATGGIKTNERKTVAATSESSLNVNSDSFIKGELKSPSTPTQQHLEVPPQQSQPAAQHLSQHPGHLPHTSLPPTPRAQFEHALGMLPSSEGTGTRAACQVALRQLCHSGSLPNLRRRVSGTHSESWGLAGDKEADGEGEGGASPVAVTPTCISAYMHHSHSIRSRLAVMEEEEGEVDGTEAVRRALPAHRVHFDLACSHTSNTTQAQCSMASGSCDTAGSFRHLHSNEVLVTEFTTMGGSFDGGSASHSRTSPLDWGPRRNACSYDMVLTRSSSSMPHTPACHQHASMSGSEPGSQLANGRLASTQRSGTVRRRPSLASQPSIRRYGSGDVDAEGARSVSTVQLLHARPAAGSPILAARAAGWLAGMQGNKRLTALMSHHLRQRSEPTTYHSAEPPTHPPTTAGSGPLSQPPTFKLAAAPTSGALVALQTRGCGGVGGGRGHSHSYSHSGAWCEGVGARLSHGRYRRGSSLAGSAAISASGASVSPRLHSQVSATMSSLGPAALPPTTLHSQGSLGSIAAAATLAPATLTLGTKTMGLLHPKARRASARADPYADPTLIKAPSPPARRPSATASIHPRPVSGDIDGRRGEVWEVGAGGDVRTLATSSGQHRLMNSSTVA